MKLFISPIFPQQNINSSSKKGLRHFLKWKIITSKKNKQTTKKENITSWILSPVQQNKAALVPPPPQSAAEKQPPLGGFLIHLRTMAALPLRRRREGAALPAASGRVPSAEPAREKPLERPLRREGREGGRPVRTEKARERRKEGARPRRVQPVGSSRLSAPGALSAQPGPPPAPAARA